uniref:EGF-like domain-containing protein n=1 Tax=Cuerna arida TaxID=1464854 RepID=A0A1B6G6Q6_9HEMI
MLYFSAYVYTLFYYLTSVLIPSVSSQQSCSSQSSCQQHSQCMFSENGSKGTCVCDDFYYAPNSPSNNTCVECPEIGQSCKKAQCCNEDCLVCYNDVCMYIYNDFCLGISDSERERFQRVAQCILAVALILTASILIILFWKACTKRHVLRRRMRHMSIDSFASLNSIQRMVLLQLQDRPPPYSREYNHPRKLVNEITDPPPSYIEAVGDPNQAEGVSPIFIVGEYPISRTPIQDFASPLQENSLSSATSSSSHQNTALLSVTPSNENSTSQLHIALSPTASPLHAVESYPSQNRLERCCNSNSFLTLNTELYM